MIARLHTLGAVTLGDCAHRVRAALRWPQIQWLRWKRHCAAEELRTFQARFDVGPTYLVTTLIHINALDRDIAALGG